MAKIREIAAAWATAAAVLASCAEPAEIAVQPPVTEATVQADTGADALSAPPPSPAMTPAVLTPGAEAELMLREAAYVREEEDDVFRWILYDSCAEAAGFSSAYLAAHAGGSAALTIPPLCGELPVRTVGEDAFSNACGVHLTELILPDGLYEIGARAFAGQSGLRLVEIPDSVLRIGAEAFSWEENGEARAPLLYMDGAILPAGREAYVNEKIYDAIY